MNPRKDQTRVPLCLACARPNKPQAHFCARCGAPISRHAVMDPIALLQSEGYAYWKASRSPRKLIVVIGMWMLFGPMLLAVPLGLIALMFERGATDVAWSHRDGLGALAGGPIAIIFIAGMLWISGTLLYRTTTNYQNRKPEASDAAAD